MACTHEPLQLPPHLFPLSLSVSAPPTSFPSVQWFCALGPPPLPLPPPQVSRSTFTTALRDCGSVLMCPGGQAELIYTHRMHLAPPNRELVIYAGHKVGQRIGGGGERG